MAMNMPMPSPMNPPKPFGELTCSWCNGTGNGYGGEPCSGCAGSGKRKAMGREDMMFEANGAGLDKCLPLSVQPPE